MTAKGTFRIVTAGTLVLGASFWLRAVTSAEPRPAVDGPKPSLTESLGGESRYLAHVSTDKPVYKPGENVYLRGVILHANTRRPLEANAPASAMVQIKGPKGEIVASGYAGSQESVIGFSWPVPKEQAGGQYTAVFTFPDFGYAPAERKFEVRSYRAPRLKSQIVFVRDGYGPGDTVTASAKVERAEGGVPADARVTVIARVDGNEVYQGQTQVDSVGNVFARFELPKEIARGEGTLAFVVEDGGIVETASKTIPILLQTVDLQMYPEGGDLVAGLPNRVYLAALTPAKKPADLAGVIVDGDGEEVAEFHTEHEGRGRFRLTPKAGAKYALKITEPAGIRTTYPLPEIKSEGAVVSAAKEVFARDEPVTLSVAATTEQPLKVTLARRDVQVAAADVKATAGKPTDVTLKIAADDANAAEGVLVATVWDANGKPLAERLVFREPASGLRVSVKADRERYTPGSPAKLTVKTTDADGKPVSAVVGITVTDDSVLEMIEKREQAPSLPVMVLLESDVKELADAHVYLDSENSKAPLAVDLLLGTQGWRRFAMVDTAKFIAENGDPARRVLALKMATPRERLARFGGVGGQPGMVFRGAANQNGAAVPQAAPARAAAEVKSAVEAAPPGAPAPVAGPVNEAKPADKPAEPAGARPDGREDRAIAGEREAAPQLQRALEEAEKVAEKQQLLRDEADGDAIDGLRLNARRKRMALNPVTFVREYAHQVRENRQPGDRVDFTETLYWTAGVRTDEKTGEATVSFAMNDSVTSFRVFADAFNSDGALAHRSTAVESVEPFYVEPKLPLEVTAGDRIDLPLGLINGTPEELSGATVQVEAGKIKAQTIEPFTLAGDARVRRIISLNVGELKGDTLLTLNARAGQYADKVTRPLSVKPLGFPMEVAHGGVLFRDDSKSHEIVIPEQMIAGSLEAKVSVFPSPMANLTEALARMIQEPYGCFEQTSSTTYPLVMAQQYFQSHAGVDPQLIERSSEMLAKGYDRLTSFECKSGGYEWFGQDPGHEALTAYGLLEFTDMAEVRNVDTAMLERTRKWLLGTRDGKGGFKRERRALHTWQAEPEVSNAYITWALLRAGEKDLDAEVAWVLDAADKTKNSYVVALAANVAVLAGDKAKAQTLLDRLITLQESDGHVKGATMSIVGSGGDALNIETTAFAALAWLSDREYADFADGAIRHLAESCKGGRYGSTQSTVLALQAIVTQDKLNARPKAPGTVQLVVDDKPVGEPVAFDTNTQGAIQLPDMAALLKPGKHKVAVKMDGGSSMPYTMAVKLNTVKPNSSDECAVKIETALRDKTVQEGGITEATVAVTNLKDETIPTPIAIVGLPGGLEVRHDQLKELVKSEKIAAYEVLGRNVVLYWRALEAKQKVELPLSLVAAVPGQYAGPASTAYLYYTDEHKHWIDPLNVTITPRAGEVE